MDRLKAAQSQIRNIKTASEAQIARAVRTAGSFGTGAVLGKMEAEDITVDIMGAGVPEIAAGVGAVAQFIFDDDTAVLAAETVGNAAASVVGYKRFREPT